MENSFSSSDQELSDTNTGKAKCSILFYMTEDGTVMFEAAWGDKPNEEVNMWSLTYLLFSIKNSDLLESALATAVKSYTDSGQHENASNLKIILEEFQKLEESQKILNESNYEKSNEKEEKPLIRPLQAK